MIAVNVSMSYPLFSSIYFSQRLRLPFMPLPCRELYSHTLARSYPAAFISTMAADFTLT